MSTDRKTVYRSFSYLRCDDFASYLEGMAARGWHLESWGAGLHLRRGEPENAVYAVEVFTDASEYDTRPEMNTKEFAEYCEAAGWHLVDARGKLCIFKKLRADAHPIMTDRERLENVMREERKKALRNLSVSGTWVVLRWMDFFGTSFANTIFSDFSLAIQLGWTALFLTALASLVRLLLWKRSSRKRIESGQILYLGRGGSYPGAGGQGYNLVTVLVELVWLGCLALLGETWLTVLMLAVFAGLWLMGWLIAKYRPDSVTNEVIQTVVSCVLVALVFVIGLSAMFWEQEDKTGPEDVPLLYEDIGGEAGELNRIFLDGSSSIFGSAMRCNLDYDQEYLYYYVYESSEDWIMDRLWADETGLKRYEGAEDCTREWGAVEALRGVGGTWAVRYPNRILVIDIAEDTVLTPEQIAVIRSALID